MTESFYVIEYLESRSYVESMECDLTGPKVIHTVGDIFSAQRFDKDIVHRIVDLLQYQGKNKARKYAKAIEIKATYSY